MNRTNTYSKLIRAISLLLMLTIVTPIILKSTINNEQYRHFIIENYQNEERNNKNDSENEENKNLEEFYYYEPIYLSNWFNFNKKAYFSDKHSFGSLYQEVQIPPPEYLI